MFPGWGNVLTTAMEAADESAGIGSFPAVWVSKALAATA